MPSPSLDQLRTFVTVVRAGSLTRAARLLGVSQATVSAHVDALEATLGVRLFERDRSGVTPTAKGVELSRRVADHVDALEDAAALAGRSATASRTIHVGGAAEILSVMVVPHLDRLTAAVDAPIRLVFGLADDLLESLSAGAVDVVVSAVPPRSSASKLTSSSSFSITVWSRRAPIFSIWPFTSAAIRATARMPSSVKSMLTPSVPISALYCSGSDALVSDRIATKSSSVSPFSSTRIGRRP